MKKTVINCETGRVESIDLSQEELNNISSSETAVESPNLENRISALENAILQVIEILS